MPYVSARYRIARAMIVLALLGGIVIAVSSGALGGVSFESVELPDFVRQALSEARSVAGSLKPIGGAVEYTIITDQSAGGQSGPRGVGEAVGTSVGGAGRSLR